MEWIRVKFQNKNDQSQIGPNNFTNCHFHFLLVFSCALEVHYVFNELKLRKNRIEETEF